jgi:hypothetical protein
MFDDPCKHAARLHLKIRESSARTKSKEGTVYRFRGANLTIIV